MLAKHDENYMPPEAATPWSRRKRPEEGRHPVKASLNMIPELGHFSLILALLLAVVQGIAAAGRALRAASAWMAVARPLAHGQFLFVAIAFGCLAYSFLHSDFSVLNVAPIPTPSCPELPVHRYVGFP